MYTFYFFLQVGWVAIATPASSIPLPLPRLVLSFSPKPLSFSSLSRPVPRVTSERVAPTRRRHRRRVDSPAANTPASQWRRLHLKGTF
jgi:hypothetical protein